nr:toll/interleukin-1 receptor domain-containing protein [Kineosporia babensis]
MFVSWSRKDKLLKNALIGSLEDHLGIIEGLTFSLWQDVELAVGLDWDEQLQQRLAGCDYGLLLLSPSFFSSVYIRERELSWFTGTTGKPMLPVMLRQVPLDGSRRTGGVELRQIFHDPLHHRAFADARDRDAFARELAEAIRRRVLSDRAGSPPTWGVMSWPTGDSPSEAAGA